MKSIPRLMWRIACLNKTQNTFWIVLSGHCLSLYPALLFFYVALFTNGVVYAVSHSLCIYFSWARASSCIPVSLVSNSSPLKGHRNLKIICWRNEWQDSSHKKRKDQEILGWWWRHINLGHTCLLFVYKINLELAKQINRQSFPSFLLLIFGNKTVYLKHFVLLWTRRVQWKLKVII